MIQLGKLNTLRIDRFTPPGAFLVDNEGNDVLLPTRYIPSDAEIDDQLEVFIYNDSEDRIIAVTTKPHLMLNEFGILKVRDVNNVGAFLDWGLEKDLLVPYRQQGKKMQINKWYLVYMYLDELTNRLAATAKVQKHYENEKIELSIDDEVDLLIAEQTDFGLNVVVNNKYRGLIFQSEIFHELMMGDRVKGYVKEIRPDNKIDIRLRKKGLENLEEAAEKILRELKNHDGFIPLNDKSTPEEIQSDLEMSKKNFKRSIGILFRKKLINITNEGIHLIN